jgi:PAN domain-containing protein
MHLKAAAVARLLHSGLLGLALAVAAMTQAWAQQGFDRPGGDYTRFVVPSADPAVCSARCDRDGRCRAWTFSYPNTAASGGATVATCWLKHQVTPPKENQCCVSGVKGGGLGENRPGPIENAIDRYGGDYKNFDIPTNPSSEACMKACEDDNRCRAWTFVRSGYVGAAARCYLKDKITRPRRKPCCVSGVVR